MAGQFSNINDRDFDLLKKIAWNTYEYAGAIGISGLTPPNINDTYFTLLKKITYYTAVSANN